MKKFLTSEFYFLKQHRVVLRFTVAYFLIAWSVIWFMDFSNETVFGPITRKTGALNVFFSSSYLFTNVCNILQYLNYFMAPLLILTLVYNNSLHKMSRQRILMGCSRNRIFISYLFQSLIIATLISIMSVVITLLFSKSNITELLTIKNGGYLSGYFLQNIIFLQIVLTASLLTKKPMGAAFVLIIYFIAESFIYYYVSDHISLTKNSVGYFPMDGLAKMLPPLKSIIIRGFREPSYSVEPLTYLFTCSYLVAFSFFNWTLVKKSDY